VHKNTKYAEYAKNQQNMQNMQNTHNMQNTSSAWLAVPVYSSITTPMSHHLEQEKKFAEPDVINSELKCAGRDYPF
jgi:hypothetical protein